MAMLRMFQRKTFSVLPPNEVEDFHANGQEQEILDQYTDQTLHGTAPQVADALEELHAQTRVDELMLVVQGHSRRAQSRTVELIADHYSMPLSHRVEAT